VVKSNTLPNRLAFSLIEIVFTIVIVGVIIMSLPTMTEVSSKGIERNLVQEAIFAASAELNQATSYYWDRNSLDLNSTSTLAKVINVNNDCNVTTKLRPGHINQIYHRVCLNDTNLTAADVESNTTMNLNNAVKTDAPTFTDNGGAFNVSASGYKETLYTTVTVNFASFGDTTQASKNIKKITVSISNGNEVLTKLSAYSANIGEVDYNRRSY